jgi:hypothetical protein
MDIDAGEAVFRGRFGATHFIESIPTRGRNVADWQPFISGRLTDDELIACVDEHRGGPQKWLVMWTKAHTMPASVHDRCR